MRQRLSLSVALCVLVALAVAPLFAGEESPGKQVYLDQKCDMCHAVSTAGIEGKTDKGGDLVGLADQYDAEWLTQYLKKEADKDGKQHVKGFKGTDEDLKALVDWLLEQQAEG